MIDTKEILSPVFGFSSFRQGQEQTVEQLINGHSSLAIFPTGSGKSLCYQYTALTLPHLTLVVSPLLALMKDQLAFLSSKGIPAASIDSSQSFEAQKQVVAGVRNGDIKILMVSVERFKNERFRQLMQSVPLSMLVVDEAHCISEWGHNFRPDYLKLPSYQQGLNIPLVLLLTATATEKVQRDMCEKFAIKSEHVVTTGFYRSNLHLQVEPVSEQNKNAHLLGVIKQQQGSGIVYVTLQQTAENVAQWLSQQGVNAKAYHAGFIDADRQAIQNGFMTGKVDVIVATIAFGMGIDKSDIRFVIHYDLPKSIENYSQEIGRAGRDGKPSTCVTLANLDGITTVENFVYGDTPNAASTQAVLQTISDEVQGELWEVQLNPLSLACNIKQLPLKTLLVQLELLSVILPQYSYFADFKYKFITSQSDILSTFEGERRTFLNAIFSHSQFKKVWGEPNFDAIFQHYQGDRSRVVAALEYLHEQQHIELATKKMTEVYRVDVAALKRDGLANELAQYFLEKETSEIHRIGRLIDFFQYKGCLNHALARYFGDRNAPVNCGHCSVCDGRVAKLSYSHVVSWPSDEQLQAAIAAFTSHMDSQALEPMSIESISRFLTGLTEPIFTRRKVKQVKGFGLCEGLGFSEVKAKVDSITTQ